MMHPTPEPSRHAIACLRLRLTAGIGDLLGRRILDKAGSAEHLWEMPSNQWRAIEGVGDKLISALQEASMHDLAPLLSRCAKEDIFLLAIGDRDYPPALAACDNAPLVLFGRGNPAALHAPRMLAVVGARRATSEGIAIVRRWSRYWAEQGVVIVSGMAPGIDSGAHRGALTANAASIAVLGYGLCTANNSQKRQIDALCAAGGCVISEQLPDTTARPQFFPRRNRIIAGLTPATVIIEAATRSGSLTTARHALTYDRDLFAVPGSVLSESHHGCHQLIQNGEAMLADNPQGIMRDLGWESSEQKGEEKKETAANDPNEERICALLAREAQHIDTLVEASGLTLSLLSPALLALEMRGVIERLPGNRYALTHPA